MANTYEVSQLARALMNDNGLTQWRFQFDRASRRFGSCKYGLRTISLSENLTRANTLDRCRETILHEIAHALTPGAGHGPAWVRQARALGIKGERCFSSENTTLVGKYFSYCHKCGDTPVSSRTQRPSAEFLCRKHRTQLVWKDARGNAVQVQPKTRTQIKMICGCPEGHHVSVTIKNKMVKGARYRCQKCNQSITLPGGRVALMDWVS